MGARWRRFAARTPRRAFPTLRWRLVKTLLGNCQLVCMLVAALVTAGLRAQEAAPNQNATLAPLVQLLKQSADPQLQLDILRGLSAALASQRRVSMPDGWAELETQLAQSANAEVREKTLALSLKFGSERALAALRLTLADAAAEVQTRRQALDALIAAKDAALPPVLQALLKEPALRAAALRGLAMYDDPQSAAAILAVYPALGATEKRDALNTLASRMALAKPLLAAVSRHEIPAKDLTADLVRQLRNLKNAELDQAIETVWGAVHDSNADKQKEIDHYKQLYRAAGATPGDAARGRAVFARTCQQCHTLFGVGGQVGPDLTGSNRADLDYILQNIVDPNAIIPNDYRSWTLEATDDRVITGVVKQQDATSVTIATPNELLVIPRKEIKSLQQGQLSMMPEGILTQFNDQEVRDLIFYLSRAKQAPLAATADTVALFFNGKDFTYWDGDPDVWRVENGEIVGRVNSGVKEAQWLRSQLLLGDFRLTAKVKLTPDSAGGGVEFRGRRVGDAPFTGYLAGVGAGRWGKLSEESGRGALADAPANLSVRPGDWNSLEITAIGGIVRISLNGQPAAGLDDAAGSKQGVMALELSGGVAAEAHFKDFQLELNPNPR